MLHTTGAADGFFAHEEERLARIACFDPGRKGGDAVTSLHKHGLPVNAVEGITEVKEERPSMSWEGGRH